MWKHVILTRDEAAAQTVPVLDPVYLAWLKNRGLPPPSQKPAGNPYIAVLLGTSAKYGIDRSFVSYQIAERSPDLHFYVPYPSVLEVQKHKEGRPVRGFVCLTKAGEMVALSFVEVIEALAELDRQRVP